MEEVLPTIPRKNYLGNTSLMKANSAKIVQILLNSGADVNAKNNLGKTGCEI